MRAAPPSGRHTGAKALMALLEEQGYDFVATRPTVKQTFVHRSLLNDAERADRLLSAA